MNWKRFLVQGFLASLLAGASEIIDLMRQRATVMLRKITAAGEELAAARRGCH